jgi:predicted CXXCH cytochrome family protein
VVAACFFDDVPPLHAPEEVEPTPEEIQQMLAEVSPDELPPGWIVSVHDPVASKDCDDCHESRYSNRLVADTQNICWECHELDDFEGEYLHGPVESGYCVGCHQPHKSPFPYLLVRSEADLCSQCHDQETYPEIDAHTLEKGSDCQRCHDPHAGDREYMLREDDAAS